MRKLAVALVLGAVVSTACLAQGGASEAKWLGFSRLLDAVMDMQVLGSLAPLQLTDPQLTSLAAVYKQQAVKPVDPALVQAATAKIEDLRARFLSGAITAVPPAEEEAMGKLVQAAFAQFSQSPQPQDKPFTELSPQETLIWGILTPTQRSLLLGRGDSQAATRRAFEVIGKLRGADEQTWATARDRLATCLTAGVDEPARENRRQMVADFLNRLRRMSETEFADKQKVLGEELTALLPPGLNLAQALAEFEPRLIHEALAPSLLNPRTPALVEEMQAARAKKAGQ